MQSYSEKNATDIDQRRAELLELNSYIQTVENDVTMILQSLQWDRKHLVEALPMTTCRYDQNHRIPPDKLENHEKQCYVRSLGYSKEDILLPEPLDANANTLVTLNKNEIDSIIDYAAKIDTTFKRGRGSESNQPLSLERLQHAYTADERRALHDVVVSAAPSCHDLTELALLSGDGEAQSSKRKSRAEILAELRDMKRRRMKYRGAAKTRNYSDVLRGVIATQMEHYSEAQGAKTSDNYNKSKTDQLDEYREVHVKKEPNEYDDLYTINRETKSNSNVYDRRRDKSRDEIRRKENRRDDRHTDKCRDKYKEREKVYDDYKRDRTERRRKHDLDRDDERRKDDIDRDDRRRKDHRDRYSGSSKERRHRKDRYSDKYEDGRRKEYKDYSSSSNDIRDKHEYDSYKDDYKSSSIRDRHKEYDSQYSHEKYKEERYKRYYDYNQEYQDEYVSKKRIKQEKD